MDWGEEVCNVSQGGVEGLILFAVFAVIWGGHWFPWERLPAFRAYGGLTPVWAYTYGVSVIWSGFVVWLLLLHSELVPASDAARFLSLVIVSAGAGAVIPRLIRLLFRGASADDEVEIVTTELERARNASRATEG